MSKDPVCEMDVDEGDAPRSEYEGSTFYFCSQECKDRFDLEPAHYADTVEASSR
jgi:YHS domain-containing protein